MLPKRRSSSLSGMGMGHHHRIPPLCVVVVVVVGVVVGGGATIPDREGEEEDRPMGGGFAIRVAAQNSSPS